MAPHTRPRPHSGLESGPERVNRPAQPLRSTHRLHATAAQSFPTTGPTTPTVDPTTTPTAALRKELHTEHAADAQYRWTAAQSAHADESQPTQPRSCLPWSGPWSPQPPGLCTPAVSTGTWWLRILERAMRTWLHNRPRALRSRTCRRCRRSPIAGTEGGSPRPIGWCGLRAARTPSGVSGHRAEAGLEFPLCIPTTA